MNSQLFFFLNLAIGAGFLFWFLAGRKAPGSQPTPLGSPKRPAAPPPKLRVVPAEPVVEQNRAAEKDAGAEERDRRIANAKSLNVPFLYNGHDWDAYQVLGIPAGASLPLVTKRYQDLLKDSVGGQREFYEAAYAAILKQF